ncbi:synaptotagmin-15 [Takifugu rubripes]|uniref:Synaptotagmin XV n=1 Tax=Takifugu rubripes TaxID=31033 RepID=A0A3B5KFV5_TAKRU|nr:synaptotagmin-15-like [Takifugu rubripes]|eukprot:XP_003978198.1 PREDICTED: synaptotagmin-15-like [Takifugu rubripes]
MTDQAVLLAAGLSAGLLVLLLLGLAVYRLLKQQQQKCQSQYEELPSTRPSAPGPSAPVIPVSQNSWATPREIPFQLPPRCPTQPEWSRTEGEERKMEAQKDLLAPRGSLSVSGWYPVGTVLAGLYSDPPLNEVMAPPPGMAPRLCFSVEYRHSSEQLVVSLLRLSNLPPRFHGNVTLAELRLLPDDRRSRQAKARGTGPDPEFNNLFIFQVSAVRVPRSTLSVCVLSTEQDGRRRAVGRILFPLEGELGQAGRVLWRDLETEGDTQCSDLGDVQISLCYSPALQRLSVVVLRARGLQLLPDAGVCVQVSLQIHSQVVKSKRSCVVKGESEPSFSHRTTFKLRPQHLEEACLRVELQQPSSVHSEPPPILGMLVLGPFMYARGPQLQHWMDMVSSPQDAIKRWHGLGRAS